MVVMRLAASSSFLDFSTMVVYTRNCVSLLTECIITTLRNETKIQGFFYLGVSQGLTLSNQFLHVSKLNPVVSSSMSWPSDGPVSTENLASTASCGRERLSSRVPRFSTRRQHRGEEGEQRRHPSFHTAPLSRLGRKTQKRAGNVFKGKRHRRDIFLLLVSV